MTPAERAARALATAAWQHRPFYDAYVLNAPGWQGIETAKIAPLASGAWGIVAQGVTETAATRDAVQRRAEALTAAYFAAMR